MNDPLDSDLDMTELFSDPVAAGSEFIGDDARPVDLDEQINASKNEGGCDLEASHDPPLPLTSEIPDEHFTRPCRTGGDGELEIKWSNPTGIRSEAFTEDQQMEVQANPINVNAAELVDIEDLMRKRAEAKRAQESDAVEEAGISQISELNAALDDLNELVDETAAEIQAEDNDEAWLQESIDSREHEMLQEMERIDADRQSMGIPADQHSGIKVDRSDVADFDAGISEISIQTQVPRTYSRGGQKKKNEIISLVEFIKIVAYNKGMHLG